MHCLKCTQSGDLTDSCVLSLSPQIYELMVLETKPNDAVTIIECDMKVDFAPPVGYKSPEPQKMETDADEVDSEEVRGWSGEVDPWR